MHVLIGVLTVPAAAAQDAANFMVLSGIRAIWNYTPVQLEVPDIGDRRRRQALGQPGGAVQPAGRMLRADPSGSSRRCGRLARLNVPAEARNRTSTAKTTTCNLNPNVQKN